MSLLKYPEKKANIACSVSIKESLRQFYPDFVYFPNQYTEKVKIGKFPGLKEVIDNAIKSGVKIYACEQSTQLINLERGDFIQEAQIAGAGTLNDLVLEADGTMWF